MTGAAGAVAAPARSAVLTALNAVRDPELDEPVTTLGFVASCEVAGGRAEVHLRLPTYFCAPNFAFLMVADAYDAVAAVGGVDEAVIVLDDHFAAEAINAGVAARAGFAVTFPGEAIGELDELRAGFVRKAVLAGTDRVCRAIFATGVRPDELPAMTLGDVPAAAAADLARLRARRRELGLPSGADAPLLIDPDTGRAVLPDDVRLHLGKARLSRVNIEANTGICRGMLRHRYGAQAGCAEGKESA
jgi:metal-sulfur cluster biosynthetic enzyme